MNGRSKAREGESMDAATIIQIIQGIAVVLVALSIIAIVVDKK